MVEMLLENGAICSSGNTILHQFIKVAVCTDIINNFLENIDIDVNAKNHNGITALHLACQHGNFDTVKLLVTKNADVHALDDNGENVLHYVGQTLDNGEAITKLLLEREVDINCLDRRERTALH
ncbi:putative ankyrin repeat protein RF_0381 [Zophobas morio]|uniref:putative ankyrin repeat protein RF_0381 n=1 Tax=Zophobas morio TaxID=2755281 RepID=UPI003082A823